MICSRTQTKVDKLKEELSQDYPGQVYGHPVDVSNYESVAELAKYAMEQWNKIDIWINNAGTTGYDHSRLYNQSPEMIDTIVNTNLTGTLYSCKAAITQMRANGGGHIFNMDGLGSDGRVQLFYTTYGSTKRAIPYASRSLEKELNEDTELEDHIGIHTLSPGMVLTELLLKNTKKSSRSFFNILAERPSTVADILVPKIRAIQGTEKTGEYLKILSNPKIIWRFMTKWRYKNRFFDEDGNLLVDLEGVNTSEI